LSWRIFDVGGLDKWRIISYIITDPLGKAKMLRPRGFIFYLISAVLYIGCVKSTSPGEDGRIFLFIDLDPKKTRASIGWAALSIGLRDGQFKVTCTVEGEEPVVRVFNWPDDCPVPEFDFLGKVVEGGKQVTMRAQDGTRDASITFRVDGDVHIRLYLIDPSLPGLMSDWRLERYY